ncbi:Protein CBG27985 [Caenorhabditis briggsae]|uniref:Protein CBG27985 n=1 Tax=Caenorhabditis briggsae TaxID=6238 RepID=B6IJS7_CAEBR|nr:Protein CBG27985 [Caenorhabditis briggsae]CAS00157.1 Protein CBG27985 [Caenorhabditis briggsae]
MTTLSSSQEVLALEKVTNREYTLGHLHYLLPKPFGLMLTDGRDEEISGWLSTTRLVGSMINDRLLSSSPGD